MWMQIYTVPPNSFVCRVQSSDPGSPGSIFASNKRYSIHDSFAECMKILGKLDGILGTQTSRSLLSYYSSI